ncbi:MAG: hypothetical protein P8X98_17010 [Woeseiaceae bacterium]
MRVGVLFTCVLAAMLSASAVAQEATRLALRDYLVALNEAGTRVIFSSDLVNDDMIIDAPGSGADPIAALREILPEFGLRLDDGPAGAYLIVQADVSPPLAGNSQRRHFLAESRARRRGKRSPVPVRRAQALRALSPA